VLYSIKYINSLAKQFSLFIARYPDITDIEYRLYSLAKDFKCIPPEFTDLQYKDITQFKNLCELLNAWIIYSEVYDEYVIITLDAWLPLYRKWCLSNNIPWSS
jgi:hypothetical protein